MRISGSLTALALAACACGTRDAKRRDADVPPPSGNEPRWVEPLLGAARVEASGATFFVERAPVLSAEPAPRGIEALDRTFHVTARDRGWILRADQDATKALVVDESEQPLAYVVRRLGATGGTALASPGAGSWPLRAAVCGARSAKCAVVRWSPRPGETAKAGGTERVAITVVDAATGGVDRTFSFEANGFHTGTAWVGGVAANPVRDELYLLEREGAKPAVRAVDLATGDTRWRQAIAPLDDAAGGQPVARLEIAGDGTHVVVVQGIERWGFLDRRRTTVLDSAAGTPLGDLDRPNGPGFLLAMPGRPTLVSVEVGVARDAGETPDLNLRGLTRIDPSTGDAAPLYTAGKDVQAAQGGVVLDDGSVLLYRVGLREPYEEDLPEARRIARGQAVAALLAPP